ncbi:MmgE/PrpD family protein [Streptomyces sp. HC44]|uniref:MmgE/PrpD family protein n=1 Tax=Streptomyces scabichelini TaxID=2711217 RepID=A0A6G4VAQ4_9ACTN|nr:MmgE/PrpD family protein [Streptomyces scabichelini]
MPLAEDLSSYAVSLRYSDLSTAAIHTVKQRLVDSIGCGLGAFDALPSRNGRAFAEAHPSTAATVLGTTQTTTPDVAAFVNGTMIRYFSSPSCWPTRSSAGSRTRPPCTQESGITSTTCSCHRSSPRAG